MGPCPRCGTRLLPGALACINCELPISSGAAAPPQDPAEASPPPYALPAQPQYSPYTPSPGSWPPYGAPQPAGAPVYYGGPAGPAPWTNNGLAIAGLVVSILWLGGLGSLLGVVFGHISRSQIKRRPQRGAGIALASLIIGYIGLVGSVVFWANIDNIINSGVVQNAIVQEDIKDAAAAEHDYVDHNGRFTNNGVDLSNEGFEPVGNNTIYAAYSTNEGYCLVGGHNGGTTWYIYDSEDGGLSDNAYLSPESAEAECSVGNIGEWVAVA
ncbi:MAG TPA: DUF4190 domain-containing protein [Mycobacteriales bacterium]|nr:DUF4190 domain-containing protein [Mycobacteriales bacterium]